MTITVQDVINRLIEPVGRLEHTVDKLICGSPDLEVTGIVTTFMATHQVIDQALAGGANVIITHEGTYYSHHESETYAGSDPVYLAKWQRIASSGIAIFRCHDYLHRFRPDALTAGMIDSLGWAANVEEHQAAAAILNLPPQSVKEVAEQLKARLGIRFVRVVGNPDMVCRRAGLLVGYRGGGSLNIPLFDAQGLQLIIAGEGPEWETPAYVRDAVYQGKPRAMILVGHAESEEPGMRCLAAHMKSLFPAIPIRFIPVQPDFQIV